MGAPGSVTELGRRLAAVGRAHHAVADGPDHDWADWYAEHLAGSIDEVVGFSPGPGEIAEWLRSADERHQVDAPDRSWPEFYAEYIIGEVLAERE